jgi:hypothetical protein
MKIFSLFGELRERVRLGVPAKKKEGALSRERKPGGTKDYYYIRYAMGALRVMAWVVLVIGVIGSLIWGITAGGIGGGGRILLGVVGSFLAWLALVTAKELLQLFVDVKENTRDTAEAVLKE